LLLQVEEVEVLHMFQIPIQMEFRLVMEEDQAHIYLMEHQEMVDQVVEVVDIMQVLLNQHMEHQDIMVHPP
jgi:hypothetical protein